MRPPRRRPDPRSIHTFLAMTSTIQRTEAAVTATDLVKMYGHGDTEVRALDRVSVSFHRGQFTAIMGPSGSGKSTLMHCAAGLDTVSSGSIRPGPTELTRLSDNQPTKLRPGRVGLRFPPVH